MNDATVNAYHEAGHVVVATVLGARVQQATLHPPEVDVNLAPVPAPKRRFVELAIAAAGDLAGARVAGRELAADERSAHDRQAIERLLAGLPPADAAFWLLRARANADAILAAHWPAVAAIAEILLDSGVVTGETVRHIMGDAAMRITRSWIEAVRQMGPDDQLLALQERARRLYVAAYGRSPETAAEREEAAIMLRRSVDDYLAAEKQRTRDPARGLDWVANPPKTRGEYRALVDLDEATWSRGW